MGCLNDKGQFSHWFGNIHLSGPCNRSCYFCIGQHMMALDKENNLDQIPTNLDKFLQECVMRQVKEVCLTGTNTDPLLYKHTAELTSYIRQALPNVPLALRTNAVLYDQDVFNCYDKASITICSLKEEIYRKMMGSGKPPDLGMILKNHSHMDIKINIVMGPENVPNDDIFDTLDRCSDFGIPRVNLREPYGQPHIGDPMGKMSAGEIESVLGMPTYQWGRSKVTYWDVHYVEVESVNLYANGRISITYPITKGHDDNGTVFPQLFFPGGRVQEQWL